MPEKVYKGFALLLFGLLLCAGADSLVRLWPRVLSGIPFSLLGILLGGFDLFLVFQKSDS